MNRKEFYNHYGGKKNPSMKRSFTEYDRYFEADSIKSVLVERGEDLSKFTVLDYGSGVGDYGMTFANEGARAFFYDLKECNDFVLARSTSGEMKKGTATLINVEDVSNPFTQSYDLAIFGEVLEHLERPDAVLHHAEQMKVRYIFTSSYPYRRDDDEAYWNHGGHDHGAREMQPKCREILEGNYKKVANFGGQLNLWKHRSV